MVAGWTGPSNTSEITKELTANKDTHTTLEWVKFISSNQWMKICTYIYISIAESDPKALFFFSCLSIYLKEVEGATTFPGFLRLSYQSGPKKPMKYSNMSGINPRLIKEISYKSNIRFLFDHRSLDTATITLNTTQLLTQVSLISHLVMKTHWNKLSQPSVLSP